MPKKKRRKKEQKRCYKCGAPIKFMQTIQGEWKPVRPKACYYWPRAEAEGLVYNADGHVIACDYEGKLTSSTRMGFVPHFLDCPHSEYNQAKREEREVPYRQEDTSSPMVAAEQLHIG